MPSPIDSPRAAAPGIAPVRLQLHNRREWAAAVAALGLAAAFAPLARAAPAQESAGLPLPSAINKAGRQRMLSQRMGKAWAMQALDVETAMAAKIMQQSQELFASQLGELQQTVPTSEIAAAVSALTQSWANYRRDLQLTPNLDNASRVYRSGDQTLQRAHELTGLYEKFLGTPQAVLVNVAGRERMLSQRMARAFYFGKLRIVADTAGDLKTASEEFLAGLKRLQEAPQNTPDIKNELELAAQQWIFFQSAITGALPDLNSNRNVATTSERLLQQMNEVTARYEKIAG
jgi:hypothetical protein